MTYLSMFEKFKILFDSILDYKFILVFIISIVFLTILYMIKKINVKKYITMIMVSFILVFGIIVIGDYDVLSNTFDDFATIFFGNIYFPSIYVYISVLVISFIAFIVSVLNIMIKKIYKVLNSIMFVVNNILFVIVLNIVAKNKIDVFSVNSLYTDTSLVAILELSMGLFILWVLSLLAVYITNVICDRILSKKVVKNDVEEEVFNPVLEVSNDIDCDTILDSEPDYITYNEPLVVESMSSCNSDILIKEIVNENQNDSINVEPKITFNDILNGGVPVSYYDNNENDFIDTKVNYDVVEKNNISFNDVNLLLDNNIDNRLEISVEEKTLLEKEKICEERLVLNTVSLNDLINEEVSVNEAKVEDTNIVEVIEPSDKKESKNIYTIDDYKKFIKMLNEVKNYSNGLNVNVADAVAISLISNYSVDDCMMFKNILENNLN